MTRIPHALLCVLLSGCVASDSPPVQSVARGTLGPGKTLEVFGLRRWSIQMIEDSLAKYAPGESLASHACVANLRYRLGFADASLRTYSYIYVSVDGDSTRTDSIALLVREPQDSGRVHPIRRVRHDGARLPEWRPITSLFKSNVPLFDSFYQPFLREEALAAEGGRVSGRDSVVYAAMIKVMAAEQSDRGYAKAMRVLRESASDPDRAVAALVLSRFAQRDEAWHALLDAAVEDNQWLGAGVAQEALQAISLRHPRHVNWTPVAPIIHNVLDGTALPALVTIIDALRRTGVDHRAAAALLGGGGEMLTALLESSQGDLSGAAHDLLVKLHGRDLGRRPADWRRWIATLDVIGSTDVGDSTSGPGAP